MQKPVRETVIAQSLRKGRKDEEERDRREVAVKMTTAYFIAKEELPFSKFQGTPGWRAAKTRHFIIMRQQYVLSSNHRICCFQHGGHNSETSRSRR